MSVGEGHAGPLDPHRPGNRILVDFNGVMVNATVSVNDHVVATHQGGYLPFSAELTGKVTGAGNLLSVVVDSRCLSVPPVGVGRGPGSVDFFQPGGIYRDVRLRVLPQVFLADLFARPTDVLGVPASRRHRVHPRLGRHQALRGHPAGPAVRRSAADRGADHGGDGRLAGDQHRPAEPDRVRAGQPVVAG